MLRWLPGETAQGGLDNLPHNENRYQLGKLRQRQTKRCSTSDRSNRSNQLAWGLHCRVPLVKGVIHWLS